MNTKKDIQALSDEQIDAIAKPCAAMGGIEDYRTFARAILATRQPAPESSQRGEAPFAFVQFSLGYIKKKKGDLPDATVAGMITRAWQGYEGEIWRAAAHPPADEAPVDANLKVAVLRDALIQAKESFQTIHGAERIGFARDWARSGLLRASEAISKADGIAAQPSTAQGDAVGQQAGGWPVGYSVNRVEGHGWYIDPPKGGRWVAHDGTPAADFIAALAQRAASQPDSERDAARYRWLRSDDIGVPSGQREINVYMERLPFREDQSDELLTGQEMDAAIDAAMAAQQGEKGGA